MDLKVDQGTHPTAYRGPADRTATESPARPPARSAHVRIEELVLEGFAPGDRHAIGEAVRVELTRLLAERDALTPLARSRAVDLLDGGAVSVTARSRPGVIGAQVARAIFRVLAS